MISEVYNGISGVLLIRNGPASPPQKVSSSSSKGQSISESKSNDNDQLKPATSVPTMCQALMEECHAMTQLAGSANAMSADATMMSTAACPIVIESDRSCADTSKSAARLFIDAVRMTIPRALIENLTSKDGKQEIQSAVFRASSETGTDKSTPSEYGWSVSPPLLKSEQSQSNSLSTVFSPGSILDDDDENESVAESRNCSSDDSLSSYGEDFWDTDAIKESVRDTNIVVKETKKSQDQIYAQLLQAKENEAHVHQIYLDSFQNLEKGMRTLEANVEAQSERLNSQVITSKAQFETFENRLVEVIEENTIGFADSCQEEWDEIVDAVNKNVGELKEQVENLMGDLQTEGCSARDETAAVRADFQSVRQTVEQLQYEIGKVRQDMLAVPAAMRELLLEHAVNHNATMTATNNLLAAMQSRLSEIENISPPCFKEPFVEETFANEDVNLQNHSSGSKRKASDTFDAEEVVVAKKIKDDAHVLRTWKSAMKSTAVGMAVGIGMAIGGLAALGDWAA